MILKFDNGAPIVEGSPSELSEVIALLNGGSLRVNIVPGVPSVTVQSSIVSGLGVGIATAKQYMDKCAPFSPDDPEPTASRQDVKPTKRPRTQLRSGPLPRIPHSEDEWLEQQQRDHVPRSTIIEALRSRGCPDVSSTDLNNRMTWIRKERERKTIAARPPTPHTAQKYLETDEEINDLIASMANVSPFEIAAMLSRRTKDQWTGAKVVEKLEAIKRAAL